VVVRGLMIRAYAGGSPRIPESSSFPCRWENRETAHCSIQPFWWKGLILILMQICSFLLAGGQDGQEE